MFRNKQWVYTFLTVIFFTKLYGLDFTNTNDPLLNFHITCFEKAGYPTFQLRGKEASYVQENLMKVKNLSIQAFSKAKAQTQYVLESDEAVIEFEKKQAHGNSLLEVSSHDFQLTGKNWKWNGLTKSIEINKEVKIIFKQKALCKI